MKLEYNRENLNSIYNFFNEEISQAQKDVLNFLEFVEAVEPIRLFQNIVWKEYIEEVLTSKHGRQTYYEYDGDKTLNKIIEHVIKKLPENKYVWYNESWSGVDWKVEEYELDFEILSIAFQKSL